MWVRFIGRVPHSFALFANEWDAAGIFTSAIRPLTFFITSFSRRGEARNSSRK